MARTTNAAGIVAGKQGTRVGVPVGAYAGLGVVALLWGANYVILSASVHGMSPYLFAPLRFCLASGVLWLFLNTIEGPSRPSAPGSGAATRQTLSWRSIIILSFFGITLSSLTFTVSLSLTSATHGAVLSATSTIFAVLLAILLGQERASIGMIGGVLLSFLGVVGLVLSGQQSAGGNSPDALRELLGDLTMLASAATWAIYAVRMRVLTRNVSALRVTTYATAVGACFLFPVGIVAALTTHWATLPVGSWLGTVYAAVFATGVANTLWARGIKEVGVAITMVYQYLPVLVAVILAVIFLHESLTLSETVSGLVILIGVSITTRAQWQQSRRS